MKKLRHWLFTLTAILCSTAQIYAEGITFEDWTSSNHGGGSTDTKTYTFTLEQPSFIQFLWSVSSESNYDWLTVTLNGQQIVRKSGENSGFCYEPCNTGENTLVVAYSKDGGGDTGSDQAIVSNISIVESGSSQFVNFLPYGQTSSQPWEAKYFMSPIDAGITPGEDWYVADFDDSAWANILGPISNITSYYYATSWEPEYSTYWVRRHFTIDSIPSNIFLSLQVIHDDGCQIYLNGNLIYNNNNVVSSTNTIMLTSEQNAFLREGDNVIAATVSNSGKADAYMDFGLNAYTIENGIIYLGTTAHEIYNKNQTEYIIKEGTTHINSQLFYDMDNLQSVSLPNSVKVIGERAFYSCNNLKTITIPNDVISIGGYAFQYCEALDSVVYNATNCTTVPNNLFNNCSNLKTFIIGDDAESIPANLLYDDNVQKVVIGNNVKAINACAFYSCNNLTDINIPNSVEVIGDNAFYDCTSFPIENGVRYVDCCALEVTDKNQTTYTLKEDIRYLGSALFSGCSSMTSVNIPVGVKAIGYRTFYNCRALTSLTLPDGVTSIGDQAFYDCRAMSSINIPSGVTAIGYQTFSNCDALTSLTLNSVTSIGEYAFDDCNNLQSLTLPESMTSIGKYAFQNCASLANINIPSGITTIGNNTFYNCDALKNIILPEGITSIGSHAFYSCGALTSTNIPTTVTSIEENAFYGCSVLKDITLPAGLTNIGQQAFYDCDAFTTITIPEGITSLPYRAFGYCNRLLNMELPATLTSIGSDNFYNSNLSLVFHATGPPVIDGGCSDKIIYVPSGSRAAYLELYPNNTIIDGEGVTANVNITEPGTLGEEAIKQAEYLYNINNLIVRGTLNNADIESIKNSMTSLVSIDMSGVNMDKLPESFLYNNKKISKVVLPESLNEIGGYAFQHCSRLQEITLPENLQVIRHHAFYGTGISAVNLPSSIVDIEYNAFEECRYLKNIIIPSSVKTLQNSVFFNCASLLSVELPDSLTSIGWDTFRGCTSLTSVEIPNTVATINGRAFYDCYVLKTVTFPLQLTSIGDEAFRYCYALENIELPTSLTSLGSYAFSNCDQLQSVTVPGVTTIGDRVFEACDNLKEVSLPTTLDRCGNYIFSGCNKLQSVTCQSLFPPITTYIAPHDACVLYAPEWTLEKYKLATGWSGFKLAEPIPGVYPADITLYKEESLSIPDAGLPEGYNPSMKLAYYNNSNIGKLTMRGDMPFNLSIFEMEQTRSTSSMTALINRGNVTADSVVTKMTMSANTWHYLTFPYDVKVSDIITEGGNWIICYYDGEARAQADFGNTWKTVPFDSILHAGEGYIWHSDKSNFVVPAVANNNRNLIFAKEARYIQLKEHAASTVANYGWNLTGNPYPCYYDTRFMEFTSPITVRSGSSYAAYSPVDDSYILMPNEAFFVQCSADHNNVGFTLDGRQTNNTVRNLTAAPAYTHGNANGRIVLNLYLENNNNADHTRLVVNEKAEMGYEISCDASKFMSDDNTQSQLFTFVEEERMAINERPLADGKAALGVYIGVGGTHTISLDTRATNTQVILIDKVTGIETDLTTFSYDFTAEAGTYTDRFEIVMKRTGETGIAEATTGTVKVVAMSGAISVTNANAPINVYNAAGALVTTMSGDAITFEVEPGVYVVKVGSEAHKVSVVK